VEWIPTLVGTDARLSKRYHRLVVSHLSAAHRVAAGLHAEPAMACSFAATQAAWRFFANDDTTLPVLAGPLLDRARAAIPDACDRYTLVPLDWSNLHLAGHAAKADRVELANQSDLGYELLTGLAVSDRDGAPIAPLCLELRSAAGLHSTRSARVLRASSLLDDVGPVMQHITDVVATAAAARPPVFVIDREADSVEHFRQWSKAGHRFVVRAMDAPHVLHGGESLPLGRAADALRASMAFSRVVAFHGSPARQYVAETRVTLARPAQMHRTDPATGKRKHVRTKGGPLPLRLVVAEVRDDDGKVLARWLILTNLPERVDAATVALWYYWRWRIESYHKLLKGAGQQVEFWQQGSASAMAKRLAVAAMACVVVWRLARDASPAAADLRQALVGLSGRQMKRGKHARPFTEPALLAGLELLLKMVTVLEHHDAADLRRLLEAALPGLLRPPRREDV
jgi:hypothetical protein